MATVKRSVLKRLVKECLVEILVEGLNDDDSTTQLVEAAGRRKTKAHRNQDDMAQRIQSRKKMLRQKIVTEARPQKTAKDFMGSITDDPVMAQIFAETAQTTLPAMMAGEKRGKNPLVPADGAAKLVQENEIEDLFEGSSNWATLAFSSSKKAP